MNCEKNQQLLVDYIEKLLSERKKRRVERHLSYCVACTKQLAQLANLREHMRTLDVPQPTEQDWQRFQRELSQKLEQNKLPVRQKSVAPAAVLRWAGAAAFALLFIVSLAMYRGYFQKRPPIQQNLETPEDENKRLATGINESALLAGLSEKEIEQFAEDAVFAEDEIEDTEFNLVFGSSPGYYEDLDELTPEECDEVLKRLDSI